jgi:hypothetical protein
MLVVLLAAIILCGDQLRRRRGYFLAKAQQYALLEKSERLLAQTDLTRARDRTAWAERMLDRGYVSKAVVISEHLNFQRAQYAARQEPSATRWRRWYEYAAAHPWLPVPPEPRAGK